MSDHIQILTQCLCGVLTGGARSHSPNCPMHGLTLDERAARELENLTLQTRPWEVIRDLRVHCARLEQERDELKAALEHARTVLAYAEKLYRAGEMR